MYGSADSGRSEIFATGFPHANERWQISTAGGVVPRWGRDGREILYQVQRPDGDQLVSTSVATEGGRLAVRDSHVLFDMRQGGPRNAYDVTRDAQRILTIQRVDQDSNPPIELISHWPALLGR